MSLVTLACVYEKKSTHTHTRCIIFFKSSYHISLYSFCTRTHTHTHVKKKEDTLGLHCERSTLRTQIELRRLGYSISQMTSLRTLLLCYTFAFFPFTFTVFLYAFTLFSWLVHCLSWGFLCFPGAFTIYKRSSSVCKEFPCALTHYIRYLALSTACNCILRDVAPSCVSKCLRHSCIMLSTKTRIQSRPKVLYLADEGNRPTFSNLYINKMLQIRRTTASHHDFLFYVMPKRCCVQDYWT